MVDDVPKAVKSRRLIELQALVQEIAFEKSRALEGLVMRLMVEGPARDPGQVFGRTECNRVVNFRGDFAPGDMVDVRVTEALPHSLLGELVPKEDA
ncbi:MAG: TRAM domain-containing protein, partial [Myxococcota bacterium]|jgi:tRNA-2-methylthio-N6-dimethylallyladenosine synthase